MNRGHQRDHHATVSHRGTLRGMNRHTPAITVAALILTACGITHDAPTATTTPTAPNGATTGATPTTGLTAPTHAHLGGTLRFPGADATITAVRIIDPGAASDNYSTPDPGTRYVAVQLRITNTGATTEQVTPDINTRVLDRDGQSYPADIAPITGCQGFAGTPRVDPGASVLGCVTFDVPTAAVVAQVQFQVDADTAGTWNV